MFREPGLGRLLVVAGFSACSRLETALSTSCCRTKMHSPYSGSRSCMWARSLFSSPLPYPWAGSRTGGGRLKSLSRGTRRYSPATCSPPCRSRNRADARLPCPSRCLLRRYGWGAGSPCQPAHATGTAATGIGAAQTVVAVSRMAASAGFGVLWFTLGPSTAMVVVGCLLTVAVLASPFILRGIGHQSAWHDPARLGS